jgi:hypothetical protein
MKDVMIVHEKIFESKEGLGIPPVAVLSENQNIPRNNA